jgi:hypothetical protein
VLEFALWLLSSIRELVLLREVVLGKHYKKKDRNWLRINFGD